MRLVLSALYHQQQNKCYPKGVYLPISKLHSILAVANFFAHYNLSQICYCGQISLHSFSDNLTPLGVAFILLVMVRVYKCWRIIYFRLALYKRQVCLALRTGPPASEMIPKYFTGPHCFARSTLCQFPKDTQKILISGEADSVF